MKWTIWEQEKKIKFQSRTYFVLGLLEDKYKSKRGTSSKEGGRKRVGGWWPVAGKGDTV